MNIETNAIPEELNDVFSFRIYDAGTEIRFIVSLLDDRLTPERRAAHGLQTTTTTR
jgi:hypothetical protein